MISLSIKHKHILPFVSEDEIRLFEQEIKLHRDAIYNRSGKGSEFLGWVDLPENTDSGLIESIESDARTIREQSDAVVVVGIGGSYLGARAVIEALSANFDHRNNDAGPQVVYAGHHLDEDYLYELLQWLDNRSYSVIVISKSGTTTEPAIAFRLLRRHLEKKVGKDEAARRIFAITDASKGALKKLAVSQGYATYTIPDDVGGRYSVLTPVGLLPIAVAGHDIRELMEGAGRMAAHLRNHDTLDSNPSAQYAVIRNILLNKGMSTEIMASYNPAMQYMIEWWKQLFGESEGKEGKGIFPAGVIFTTDLHSMGQYIQEGQRHLFETLLNIGQPKHSIVIPEDPDDDDGLNYIAGKRISEVSRMASGGTVLAHVDGGVPNIELYLPELNAAGLGEIIYFFEMACALSGYMLGVNPFDQPGVEAYKRNMFALLEKPGFEEEGKVLKNRL